MSGRFFRIALCLVAVIVLLSTFAASRKQSPSSLQSGAPWPKFHANSQNTGVSNASGASGLLKWTFTPTANNQTDFFTCSPVVGSDGTIYIGDVVGNFYAINGSTGAVKWTFKAGAFDSCAAIGSDGTVYIGSGGDFNLYALNPTTGTQKWAFATNGGIAGGPAIASNGTIYIGSIDDSVYAINPSDGSQIWSFPLAGGGILSSPAIDASGNIIVGSADDNIYSIIASNGTEYWAYPTGGEIEGSGAVASNGDVYMPSFDGDLYAINAATGSLAWTATTGKAVDSSPAVGTDGTVYFGTMGAGIFAVNGSTGATKWVFDSGGSTDCSPAIGSDGTVFIGADDSNLYAVNGSTGLESWSFATGRKIFSSPAIGKDGTLYVASDSLYAIGQAPISSFYASQTTVTGGQPTTGVVQIASKAAACTSVVYLTGGDSSIDYPGSVTLAAGKTGVSFHIGTKAVTAQKTETITAKYGTLSKQLTLTVNPLVISKFYVSPTPVIAGETTRGVVQLSGPAPSGGAVVTLSDGGSTAITIPSQAMVPAGSTGISFSIPTASRNSPIAVTITATYNSANSNTEVDVVPFNFYFSPSFITNGATTHGVIQVGSNPNGQTFSLKSSSTSFIVPSTVQVPAGDMGVSFTATSSTVSASTAVNVTATSGAETNNATLTINPYAISNFYASPSTITGGSVTYGVVQLAGPAGPGGDVVSLASGDSHVVVPSTVTVPAGKTGVSFQIESSAVTAQTNAQLTAILRPTHLTTTVTLNP